MMNKLEKTLQKELEKFSPWEQTDLLNFLAGHITMLARLIQTESQYMYFVSLWQKHACKFKPLLKDNINRFFDEDEFEVLVSMRNNELQEHYIRDLFMLFLSDEFRGFHADTIAMENPKIKLEKMIEILPGYYVLIACLNAAEKKIDNIANLEKVWLWEIPSLFMFSVHLARSKNDYRRMNFQHKDRHQIMMTNHDKFIGLNQKVFESYINYKILFSSND